jgi:hypothetical protein
VPGVATVQSVSAGAAPAGQMLRHILSVDIRRCAYRLAQNEAEPCTTRLVGCIAQSGTRPTPARSKRRAALARRPAAEK